MDTKNKHDDVDNLLKRALSSSEKPDDELIQKIKYGLIKEESILKKSTIKRSFGSIAAAALAFVLMGTTVFAAWYFLKPSEVADIFEDKALSAAFESETAVNINSSVTSGDYTFTMLAVVTGEDITDLPYYSDDVQNERTYAVLAIQKADGSAMPNTQDDKYGETLFFASPLVRGVKPWELNIFTMNGGYSETVVDGTMYRLVECDNFAIFADHQLYFAISTSIAYDSNAFIYNEQTGEITASENYNGASAIFNLPLDKNSADPIRAEQYLNNLHTPSDNNSDNNVGKDNSPDSLDWGNAVQIDSTVKKLAVGSDDKITFSYDTAEYGSGTITAIFNDCFENNNTAQSIIVTEMSDDDTLYAVRFSIDEKGIITGSIVVLK